LRSKSGIFIVFFQDDLTIIFIDWAVEKKISDHLIKGFDINTSLFSAYAPGGGYKESGQGRERGVAGIREFQEQKHMVIGELK